MGSGEEWANDAPKRGGWGCPLQLAGVAASIVLVGFAVYVTVSDLMVG